MNSSPHSAIHTPGSVQALSDWLATPTGRYLMQWEQAQLDAVVDDLFGYHALQLGLPQLPALAVNRMPHRWVAVPEAADAQDPSPGAPLALVTHAAALPFQESSLDLVVLPHTLELSADPHAVLREVQRVLVPEGRVVICGFNPLSLWGLRQTRARMLRRVGLGATWCGTLFLPQVGDLIAPHRLRDWLKLLSFDVQRCQMGCFRPAVTSKRWLDRFAWMDAVGKQSWPFLGSAYFVVATKKVLGMHILGPAWKPSRAKAGAIVVQRPSVGRQPLPESERQ